MNHHTELLFRIDSGQKQYPDFISVQSAGRSKNFSHVLSITQCANGQVRMSSFGMSPKSCSFSWKAQIANHRCSELGLTRSKITNFCNNEPFLQLIHKKEGNSIKVGNDFCTLIVIRFKLQRYILLVFSGWKWNWIKVWVFLSFSFFIYKCGLDVSKFGIDLHESLTP